MKKLITLILGFFWVILSTTFVFAEALILKDGKRIEGQIVEKTGGLVKINVRGITLSYDTSDIERIEGEAPSTADATQVTSAASSSSKTPQNSPMLISPTQKMLAQLFLAIAIVAYLHISPPNSAYATKINIPYTKDIFIDLGIFYTFFALMVLVGSSNAVNLTDGLDGLAIGAIVISSLTFIVFTYLAGHAKFSTYLRIVPVAGAGEVSIFLASIVGGGLGFL